MKYSMSFFLEKKTKLPRSKSKRSPDCLGPHPKRQKSVTKKLSPSASGTNFKFYSKNFHLK